MQYDTQPLDEYLSALEANLAKSEQARRSSGQIAYPAETPPPSTSQVLGSLTDIARARQRAAATELTTAAGYLAATDKQLSELPPARMTPFQLDSALESRRRAEAPLRVALDAQDTAQSQIWEAVHTLRSADPGSAQPFEAAAHQQIKLIRELVAVTRELHHGPDLEPHRDPAREVAASRQPAAAGRESQFAIDAALTEHWNNGARLQREARLPGLPDAARAAQQHIRVNLAEIKALTERQRQATEQFTTLSQTVLSRQAALLRPAQPTQPTTTNSSTPANQAFHLPNRQAKAMGPR
ncbi:hypothetical protein ACN28G_22700 [Micromonospora sp. WMMA1923]|uniref:hypothetical protein n=1 Tax=Micromonospora sp. WMMA1923 TaxID=3404125 RepID=UPI003B930B11